MNRWHSSTHPISDIRDWNEAERLEVRPDFQRLWVWSSAARIMLMDTILNNIPMPKIFLANTIRDGKTYRVVIDGQQRITAILAFLRNEFSLDKPYSGKEQGKTFSQLDETIQNEFLGYQIDFNEAQNLTKKEVREVYARVNKYTVPLTKQELRKADFPGDFLKSSENLTIRPYFDRANIFTPARRRRYRDVEYISELLAAMIDGVQDKKKTLDSFYIEYSTWESEHRKEIVERFSVVLEELELIFDGSEDSLNISQTRFHQKSDFYSLFLAINEFVSEGRSIEEQDKTPLRDDLDFLQRNIRPESEVEICSEYAIKCVSQANSASSRRWRQHFLKSILAGTYVGGQLDKDSAHIFYCLADNWHVGDSLGMCPEPVYCCSICDQEISGDFSDCVLAWQKTDKVNQISNSTWLHNSCIKSQDWLIMDRPNNG